jgi:hypothetical protein
VAKFPSGWTKNMGPGYTCWSNISYPFISDLHFGMIRNKSGHNANLEKYRTFSNFCLYSIERWFRWKFYFDARDSAVGIMTGYGLGD